YMRRVFDKVDKIAGGLNPEEADLVKMALDNRLRMHGLKPLYDTGDESS
ncbi:MAG: hypothetical protein GY953_47885, partial [bacterium]|nr:hypothetical protein [bacterium]